MKRRNFLRFIPFAGLFTSGCIHWPGIDNKEKNHLYKPSNNSVTNVSLHELPRPIEKELTFEVNGFKVKASITTHILLECYDTNGNLYWETNSYCNFYKCIAEAHNGKDRNAGLGTKFIRFESSEPFVEKDIDKQWNNFVEKIHCKLSNHEFVQNLLPLKLQMHCMPPKVKLA